jgi:SAM-dependent methyltransferase
MWDERYAAPGYLFGTEPAHFLVDQAAHLPERGRILAVADGEGRNSVFLASRGLDVIAFDASRVAVEKARTLAAERGVSARFEVADVDGWDWAPETYDAVVAVFIQFAPPPMRARLFQGMKRTLKPGGVLMLHGYRPEQIDYGTGGPPQADNMYTEAMLGDAFGDMRILRLAAYDREIEEGKGHAGMSALIDLIAVKR